MSAAWARHDRFFILHACKHVCVCTIDDVKPIVQSSCVRTRCVHNSLPIHTSISGRHMPNLDYVHFGICIQNCSGINSMYCTYKFLYILRCDFLVTQDTNSTKDFLTVKLKSMDLGVYLLPIIIGNSQTNPIVAKSCRYPKCIMYS